MHVASRGVAVFTSELGLVWMTFLLQGWTNSVVCYQHVITKILWRHIPHHARPFIDDAAFPGSKTRYDEEKVRSGVRRFVAEHAEIFRDIMGNICESGVTVSGDRK